MMLVKPGVDHYLLAFIMRLCFFFHQCKRPLTFKDCNIIVTTTYM